ncbi:MAG: DUF3726 domain-containing protein [Sulfitobacter sp.]
MSYSLNEIEALSKRAARGAGLSWGIAEEAGKAARWLASHDLPGVELLAHVLVQNDDIALRDLTPTSLEGIWKSPGGTMCPLLAGASLNDCAQRLLTGQAIEMTGVSHPLIVLPFAAWAAIHIETGVALTWVNVRLETDGFGVWIDGPQDQISTTMPVELTCTRAENRTDPAQPPAQRGIAQVAAWDMLNSFAHRTYAPATEESRNLGAGAGTSDND